MKCARNVEIDTADVLSATVGSGTIEAGQTNVVIETSGVTANSKVFVTATSTTGKQPLIVQSKKQVNPSQ